MEGYCDTNNTECTLVICDAYEFLIFIIDLGSNIAIKLFFGALVLCDFWAVYLHIGVLLVICWYLCILILLTIWIWIFFLPGLTIQANTYHKMLIGWTSQKIKDTYSTHNAFDFKNGDIFIYKVLWNFKILFHVWSHIYAWNNNHQAFFPLVGTGGSKML